MLTLHNLGLVLVTGGILALTVVGLRMWAANRRDAQAAQYEPEPDENWAHDLRTELATDGFPVLPQHQAHHTQPLPVYRDPVPAYPPADEFWAERLTAGFRTDMRRLAWEMREFRQDLQTAPFPE